MNRALRYLLLVTLFASAALPAQLAAQSASSPDSIQGAMRSALRALASAQLWHYETHKTYSADVDSLKQAPGCVVPEGVIVGIKFADGAKGWAMESRHPDVPGQSCVYWNGTKGDVPEITTDEKQLRGSDRPGRVLCDFDASAIPLGPSQ